MSDPRLYPCFLGPYGENDSLLEKLVVEFLRDHVYWRRNFHPDDPPAIPTHAAQSPEFQAYEARLRRELHALSATLKHSVPFHSPRYIGHMVSDLLLPALAAQFLALPYNPNNVSADAAPVTIDLEIQVGLQLARMLGYIDDPTREDCAFGHLTSGGTVANYQALRLALSMKAFPVALRAAAPDGLQLPEDDWAAFNLSPDATIALLQQWQHWLAALAARERRHWTARVREERLESLGLVEFFARHGSLQPPCVVAPVTAHYSWSKGIKLLGLGRNQLQLVPESGMRIDVDALAERLDACARERRPVLMAVAVLGGTEFGTIDPVHRVLEQRQRMAAVGLGFHVHVDAAWGGYLATLFREADGTLREIAAMQAQFQGFPREDVHAAFAALGKVDSVTVDPHKLGFVPYGSGAFVCRDQRAMHLLVEDADYVFDGDGTSDYFARYRQLGRYIPEGSKSGAAAAAVYVTHRVMPLDHDHFGAIMGQSIRATEAFRAEASDFADRIGEQVLCRVPFEPDSNLVCLTLNPVGNREVARANAFVRALFQALRADPTRPVQMREFFGSMTTLEPERLGERDTRALLDALGLDAATLDSDSADADRIVILRHTLMNPFLIDTENSISYIGRYFAYLEREIRRLLTATGEWR
ncbi:MAG TPA: pyridoxal-dependent decarboxylase [Xanthomonadaceae bacterium]|nr:pyridoxal-dependent decarboxylase [Xanthomonadaceae bacterium]